MAAPGIGQESAGFFPVEHLHCKRIKANTDQTEEHMIIHFCCIYCPNFPGIDEPYCLQLSSSGLPNARASPLPEPKGRIASFINLFRESHGHLIDRTIVTGNCHHLHAIFYRPFSDLCGMTTMFRIDDVMGILHMIQSSIDQTRQLVPCGFTPAMGLIMKWDLFSSLGCQLVV